MRSWANPRRVALQLDKLVGLAMLVAASVVFLYYSIWTLLMVRVANGRNTVLRVMLTLAHAALRRLGPSTAKLLPPARLGCPYTCHPRPAGLCRCGYLPEHCHDPKQQEEGCQGQGGREEEGLGG
jgi:hypothetical protein